MFERGVQALCGIAITTWRSGLALSLWRHAVVRRAATAACPGGRDHDSAATPPIFRCGWMIVKMSEMHEGCTNWGRVPSQAPHPRSSPPARAGVPWHGRLFNRLKNEHKSIFSCVGDDCGVVGEGAESQSKWTRRRPLFLTQADSQLILGGAGRQLTCALTHVRFFLFPWKTACSDSDPLC